MHPLLSSIVQNPAALAAGRSVREVLGVPNRGFLSKENQVSKAKKFLAESCDQSCIFQDRVKHATGLLQIVQDLETGIAPLVAEADAKKNRVGRAAASNSDLPPYNPVF